MTKISKLPEKNSPITVDEIVEAADIFFPLFNEVSNRMPEKASTEDTLCVMESVVKLAQTERAKKREEEVKLKFGFAKNPETGMLEVTKEEVVDEE